MTNKASKDWALILGGSSGFGLAAARALAKDGLNLCIAHRDRKGAMEEIERHFDAIRSAGVEVVSINTNALESEGRNAILTTLADHLKDGKVRVLLHSIALGNLKPIAPVPLPQSSDGRGTTAIPAFDPAAVIGDEDMAQTIYNMGSNLLTWVQQVFSRKMFAADARVFGLTSEGNTIAWRGYAAVSAAKATLEAVSRSIAREYGVYGIRCNILQPGVTDTKALSLIPGASQMKENALRRNPCGRLTTPEDVAGVIALLSRPEAGWINGALIHVDGGEHISG